MIEDTFYLCIATVAITVVGFTGVIVLLKHPEKPGLLPNEIAGVKLIVEHGLIAVLLCLIPTLVFLLSKSEITEWRVSSAVLATFLLYAILINIYRILQTTKQRHPPRTPRLMLSTFFVPTIIVLTLQASNVFDVSKQWPFAIGMFWLVLASFRMFFLFVWHIKPLK